MNFGIDLEEQIDSYKLDDSLYGMEKVNNASDLYNNDYVQKKIDIIDINEKQLLKAYYENLLAISGGIVKRGCRNGGA